MNFLALAQKVVEKTRMTGTLASVTGQRGELLRAVNWVNEAWFDIQLSNTNWDWMRYEFTFNTIANDDEYTPAEAGATLFSKWHDDTLRIYKTSIGISDEQFLPPWTYMEFRNTYRYGVQTPGRPTVFAIRPRGSHLLLGLKPDDIYTVYGEYQRKPTYMVDNTDEPDMPEEYHMAIVHLARMKYAADENAPEVMAEAQRDYSRIMDALAVTQIDDVTTGEPLA